MNHAPTDGARSAVAFPGQGSQSVGMMRAYGDDPVIRTTFAEASEALGEDLWCLATDGDAGAVNATRNTQPLMLTAGMAVYRAYRGRGGPAPAVMAGHSLGEVTALVAAGAIAFRDALPLVRRRAELMQAAVPAGAGAMAAILGLDDARVVALCETCRDAGEVLEAVNFNSPGQVVIAGHRAAVERGMDAARAAGAKRALALPVSVPSHCTLMAPAADRFAQYLEGIEVRPPAVPVLHNTDVTAHDDPAQIKAALARQLHSPVRWVETVRAMADMGVQAVVEAGPGRVLAGLNKRIAPGLEHLSLGDAAAIGAALTYHTGTRA